jgi:hypothetical protein
VAGDFNGDGKIDIVMLNPPLTTSAFLLILGKGDGTFQPPSRLRCLLDRPR